MCSLGHDHPRATWNYWESVIEIQRSNAKEYTLRSIVLVPRTHTDGHANLGSRSHWHIFAQCLVVFIILLLCFALPLHVARFWDIMGLGPPLVPRIFVAFATIKRFAKKHSVPIVFIKTLKILAFPSLGWRLEEAETKEPKLEENWIKAYAGIC